MSEPVHISSKSLYLRAAAVTAFIVAASALGYWIGAHSVHFADTSPGAVARDPVPAENTARKESLSPSPVYFWVKIPSGTGETAVLDEIGMAAEAGLHQYVLSVPLPWQGDMTAFLAPLDALAGRDPNARTLLHLNLDPPAQWLAAHPEDVAHDPDGIPNRASAASEAWRRDAAMAVEALASALRTSIHAPRVLGYVVSALENASWQQGPNFDRSPANARGFRDWLRKRYPDEEMLRKTWNRPETGFETAEIPVPFPEDDPAVFLALPDCQDYADFVQYASESTADAIRSTAEILKSAGGQTIQVFVPYGYSLESAQNTTGHLALGRLLDGVVDGFAGPISSFDRGLGGSGAPVAPVDSVRLHGKQWIGIGGTRTGLVLDPATGEVVPPKNLRIEDVYSVQERNFAGAVIHGAGLAWADSAGDARLHDPEMWKRFGAMATVYRESRTWETVKYPPTLTRIFGALAGEGPFPPKNVLAVVVDESSRYFEKNAGALNKLLLGQAVDAALRAGVPTRYHLLRDVIEGRTPRAGAYLFLNAFRLNSADRQALHDMLRLQEAAAVWMYAPGYLAQSFDVRNVAETTRINVKSFDGIETSGSTFALAGKWLQKGSEIGEKQLFSPLFYVEDSDADVIAVYRTSGKPSIGIRFFGEGWASVFCAEPSLTPGLLREILGILEMHVYQMPGQPLRFDTMYCGDELWAIHARESGDRVFDVDLTCDVRDLLVPEAGWFRKRQLTIPMRGGETRLLEIVPSRREDNGDW